MNQVTTQNNHGLTQQQAGYNAIDHALKSEKATNRIASALGIDPSDKEAKAAVVPYAASVLMEIERNFGDGKKDLSTCIPDSIVQCVVDAARFKIMIDGRQHAHLVKFGNKATLQIGYRGFVHKIKEHFPDAAFSYKAIFEGDKFSVNSENGFDNYTHEIADPLEDNISKLRGVYVAISYTAGGRPMQAVTVMSKAQIEKVKSCAQQSFIWDKWYIEKAIVAAVKRASKIHFASIKELAEMTNYDNETNFTPYNNRQPDVKTDNPFETMNRAREENKAPESDPEVIKPDVIDVENDQDNLSLDDVDTAPREPEDLFEQTSIDQMRQAIYKSLSQVKDQEGLNDFYTLYDGDIPELPAEDQQRINETIKKIKERLGINDA